jgi:hypothetical protein
VIDINDVDGPLQDIKYMVEIAAELTDDLETNDARPGFFEISATGLLLPAMIRCGGLKS